MTIDHSNFSFLLFSQNLGAMTRRPQENFPGGFSRLPSTKALHSQSREHRKRRSGRFECDGPEAVEETKPPPEKLLRPDELLFFFSFSPPPPPSLCVSNVFPKGRDEFTLNYAISGRETAARSPSLNRDSPVLSCSFCAQTSFFSFWECFGCVTRDAFSSSRLGDLRPGKWFVLGTLDYDLLWTESLKRDLRLTIINLVMFFEKNKKGSGISHLRKSLERGRLPEGFQLPDENGQQ